jgi:hypothetical protein
VPVPSSLAELFGPGGAGAAGGVWAGFLVKSAVALVVGGLATGIGVEAGKRAAAAPHHAATPSTTARSIAVGTHTVAQVHPARRAAHVLSRWHPARAGLSRRSTPGAVTVAPTPATATPAPSTPSVTTVVENTVQSAVGTVDQVTASLPVSVPQVPPPPLPLPVQAPPLPGLP